MLASLLVSEGGTRGLSVVPEDVQALGEYAYDLAAALRSALSNAGREVQALTEGGWTGSAADSFGKGWGECHDGGQRIMDALTGELRLTIGGMQHYVVQSGAGWRVDRGERNDRRPVILLNDFSDVEKFLLCQLGEAAYKGDYTEAPYYRWYEDGVAQGITLAPVDPNNEYSEVYLLVDREPGPRGSTRKTEAISFSHPLLMDYEEIDALYRSKIPADRFTVEVDAI